MKIVDLVCSAGRTGFFFDDQKAIKTTAVMDGNAYIGEPVTPGFTRIRQAGESISVMFVLEDGQVAYGDCAAVQYSGTGGRDPLFLAADYIPVIEREYRPMFVGKEITTFKEMAEKADHHIDSATGKPMHTAARYGVTQAILDAVAKSQKKLMAEVVAEEYGQKLSEKPIPIFSQSGDDRYLNADKMILKGSAILPHALFNNLEKLGEKGEKLHAYVGWLRDRIAKISPFVGYDPVFHIDVYGTIAVAFNNDIEAIVNYIGTLEKAAAPHKLRIEGPIDTGERESQIKALAEITRLINEKGIKVEIVADEWCNTVEDVIEFTDRKAGHMAQIKTPDLGGINNTVNAILYCKEHGMGAYLGGTCNETDRSGQVCMHIGIATTPVQVLAKPGMGVDEGYMIVFNEMNRIIAMLNRKNQK